MIDNIKLVFTNKEPIENWLLENSEKFNVKRNSILNDAQTIGIYPIIAKHKNIEIRICEKIAYIQGSLHKMYNNYVLEQKKHPEDYHYLDDNNYNDFHHLEIIHALELFREYFDGLDIDSASITELEFGFNLNTKEDPRKHIEQNFLLLNHKAPISNYSERGKCFKQFKHSRFYFKVYSKKAQKNLTNNIMRIEIVLKKQDLKLIQIHCFNDLFKEEAIDNLYSLFCEKLDGFILVDNRNERKDIPVPIKDKIGNLLEPSFWKSKIGYSNINRKKKKLQNLLEDYDLLNVKNYILKLIHSKYEKLRFYNIDDESD